MTDKEKSKLQQAIVRVRQNRAAKASGYSSLISIVDLEILAYAYVDEHLDNPCGGPCVCVGRPETEPCPYGSIRLDLHPELLEK